MQKGNSTTPASSQQKRIELVQFKITPYFLIAVISFAIMCVRVFLLPEWKWWMHGISFCPQTTFMILIWHFIKWLNGRLEYVLPFEKGPEQRMFIQVAIVLLILLPLVFAGITLSRPYLPFFVNKQVIALLVMMFVVMIVLLNFSFYAGYFFRNWQESVVEKAKLEIQAAELEREKFNLQYHQLRNQVNPHYLFNTLSSLDGLIQSDAALASEFVRQMSKVYRYVLQHKESEVVRLEEETEFIGHYLYLLNVRYGRGLTVRLDISEMASSKGIVMVSLQTLIDNAIKHNTVHPDMPLNITVRDETEYLVVQNNRQERKQIETSNGQGLLQLRQLYAFLSDKPLLVEGARDCFTVKIPLLEL